jgi:hypothetical protein
MNYWIFVCSKAMDSLTPKQVFEQRMKDKFWGISEKAPLGQKVHRGDQVVFYVSRPEGAVFAGSALLASDSHSLSVDEQEKLLQDPAPLPAEHGVWFESTEIWDSGRPVKALVPSLQFVKNKDNWQAYFQGGIRQIDEDDFASITNGPVPPPQQPATDGDFVLEAHLEDFIEHN